MRFLLLLLYLNLIPILADLCAVDEHVKLNYNSNSTVKYGGTSCSGTADCQTKCSADSGCAGYTSDVKTPVAYNGEAACAILDDGSLKCWGKGGRVGDGTGIDRTSPVSINVGAGRTVKHLSNGGSSCAILDDGSLKCWGTNWYGSVGDGTTSGRASPVAISLGKKAVLVGGGYAHTCVALDDGSMKCWGRNNEGQLGNGQTSTTASTTPETVGSLGAGRTAVALSGGLSRHQCAILDDGSMKCWGKNANGQLGDGSTTDRSSPTAVSGIDGSTDAKTAISVDVGSDHTCAVMKNGDFKCWGKNGFYQLGLSGTNDRKVPTLVSLGTGRTAVFVSCTEYGTHVTLDDGSLKYVGRNSYGEGGVGSTTVKSSLTTVNLGTGRTAIFVTGTNGCACAILDDKSLKCWGRNFAGQVGDGTTTDRSSPVSVSLGSNAAAPLEANYGPLITGAGTSFMKSKDCTQCPASTTNAAGDDTSGSETYCDISTPCAQNHFVNSNYECEACSAGTYNDPGDNTIGTCDDTEKCLADQHVKVSYPSDNTKKYGSTSCSSDSDCQTKCSADSGCAGYSTSKTRPLGAGQYHMCYLVDDGTVKCLGKNQYGQLGSGSTTAQSGFSTPSLGKSAIAVDAASAHSCALLVDKTIKCWGVNGLGQLGDGSTTDRSSPVTVSGYTDVEEIALAYHTGCARLADGGVKCWGYASQGLATGTINIGGQAKILRGGGMGIMCVILTDDKLKCWGHNHKGQLGVGDTTNKNSPTEISFTGRYAVDIACGNEHCCVVLDDGNVRCSGEGGNGRLGYGNTDDRNTYGPNVELPSGKKAVKISCGLYNTYVTFSDGTVTSWGSSSSFRLGYSPSGSVGDASGEMGDNLSLIAFSTTVSFIDVFYNTKAAVLDDGKVIVWGEQSNGQLSTTSTSTISPLTELSLGTNKKGALAYSATYGPLVTGTGNSFTKNKGCTACPAGYDNDALDDPAGAETTCDFIPCAANHHILNGACTQCPGAATRAAGDSDPAVNTYCTCGLNQHVVSNVCTECPTGTTRPAGDDSSGADTVCIIAPCAKDFRVKDNVCVACPAGMTNAAGDTNANGDTYCDSSTFCNVNEYVSNHVCTACPAGTSAPYGSDPAGPDTVCTCGKDQYSDGSTCQTCSYGTFNNAGDAPNVASTCDDNDVCETNEYVSSLFLLHADKQLSNAAGYSDAITDFAKAKRLCIADSNCKGLTKDASNNYYLSDGSLSANTAYDAYEINRTKFMCHTCPSGGTRAAGDVATAATQCTFNNCAADQYVDDYECKACAAGKNSPATNPSVGNSVCTTPPCAANEHVKNEPVSGQLSAGANNVCAIFPDGAVKCWGDNARGQLGYGDITDRKSPPTATVNLGAGKTAKQVAASYQHTCAILDDDTLKCWGEGDNGRLGYGDTADKKSPPSATVNLGAGKTAKQVVLGMVHTCVILNDDTVKCWGRGPYTGYGDTDDKTSPPSTTVNLGTGKTAKQLSAGYAHTCALLSDDTVKCWGYNAKGQLGYGDTETRGDGAGEMGDDLDAVDLGTGKTAKQIVAGWQHTCAILNDDSLKCWGYNQWGKLGYGDTTDKTSPPSATVNLGTGKTVKQVSAHDHTCAILNDDTLRCWGWGYYGQLGYGDSNHKTSPSSSAIDLGTGKTAKQVAAGGAHTCVILNDHNVKCWGYNTDGQLGYGDTTQKNSPPSGTVDLGKSLLSYKLECTACPAGSTNEAGDSPDDGATECDWGTCGANEYVSSHVCTPCATGTFNDAGDSQAADTTCDDLEMCDANEYGLISYAYTLDSTKKYSGTSCSSGSDCQSKCTADSGCAGYTDDGFSTVKAWGDSSQGGTDPGVINNVIGISSAWKAFAALKSDGSITAWGDSTNGGSGAPTGTGYTSIFSTAFAFAAMKSDGSITAWGSSYGGGTGAPTGTGYTSIFSSHVAFAAMKSDGSITVWGKSTHGGSGAPTGTGYVKIFSALHGAFAALKSDGSITAWGSSSYGGTGAPTGTGYVNIFSNPAAFAALKSDGSITAWGSSTRGGSGAPTGTGYANIFSTEKAFAALKSDGSITAWGDSSYGGSGAPTGTGYVQIYSNFYAFAAMKSDGSITAWGDSTKGGSGAPTGTGYVNVFSHPRGYAFAAMKSDGSITAWGDSTWGGTGEPTDKGYVNIFSTKEAFAAIKSDGSVKVWGGSGYGGTDPSISSGAASIYSTDGAFVAVGPASIAYGPVVTGTGNSFTKTVDSGTCTACPGTGTTAAARVNETGSCTYADCQTDQYSDGDGICKACPSGRTMPTPVNPSVASKCLCAENERASGGSCTACPAGFTNAAGDNPCDICYETHCDFTPCALNHYVVGTGYSRVCTPCASGTFSPGGEVTACSSVEYCSIDQKVAQVYASDNTKKYGSTSCSDTSDCQTKCTADSGCAGYTNSGFSTVKAWGSSHSGGTDPGVINSVIDIVSTQGAFAAMKSDGSITVWGDSTVGGSGAPTGTGYVKIFSTASAFAAMKSDGSITAWGNSAVGGSGAPTGTGYDNIFSSGSAFAAMKSDGSITAWGSSTGGGSGAPSGTGYVNIFSTSAAFAAMKSDGSITAWGNSDRGGSGAPSGTGYVQIYSHDYAFAALKSDGSITAWGSSTRGGTGEPTDTGYVQIVGNSNAFAAMKSDGSITAWGDSSYGGSGAPTGTGYVNVFSTKYAFAAMKSDGSITVWGSSSYGGSGAPTGTGYTSIFSTNAAFAAMKSDGSITAWGGNGGSGEPTDKGYVNIFSNGYAFAAIKSDGSIKAWGASGNGGTDPSISSGAAKIYAAWYAFVAVGPASLAYGSVVTGTGNSFKKSGVCTDCPEGHQNEHRNATRKDGPVNTCTVRNCVLNEYSDGSVCKACPQYTGAASAGLVPTSGATQCTAVTCKADERVVSNVCTACDSTSYRAPGDQIFGGDTHCFCKDNHKVINKACVACEAGSSNPNLCYSGLQDHYCICDANYHVSNKVCTACPAGATRPAGDYGGNGDTHCICGEDQHVVNHVCTPCAGGAKRPAGDDSGGADTFCSCKPNEHVKDGKITVLSAGITGEFNCVILNDDTVKCWGQGNYGQLGNGGTATRGDGAGEMGDNLAIANMGSGQTARLIAAGKEHACALLDSGKVKCWGRGHKGQLGSGSTSSKSTPFGPVDLGTGRTVKQLASGDGASCAILDDDTLKCWGYGFAGKLGYGDENSRGDASGEMGDNLPVVDLGTGKTAKQVSLGQYHTCAILNDDTVKCWGSSYFGRTGSGDETYYGDAAGEMGDNLTAVDLGTGKTAKQISAGGYHTCAILNDDTVKCWGKGGYGRLGYGDTANRGDGANEMGDNLPVVNLGTGKTAKKISAGDEHTCAILNDDTVKCWGKGSYGRLGYENTNFQLSPPTTPVDLGTGKTAKYIVASKEHTCAGLNDDTVKCWGNGQYGQLGDGDTDNEGDSSGEMGDNLAAISLGTGKKLGSLEPKCGVCPAGSVRAAGDFVSGGVTSCACPEDFHVSGGECKACVGGTRAAGDDPSAGDTHCACNVDHKVVSKVCTACPAGQERAAGDDAGGADTSCLCKANFFSNGDGTCTACGTGAVLAAGSDPSVASQCACDAGFQISGANCVACASTEESVAGEACKCKENHYYDGSACKACAAGSTRPAGDDKTATTTCTAVTCAENERVSGNTCVACVKGMIRAAGDDATGADTQCAYQGTSHTVTTNGNYAYKIDGGLNNGDITIRVGETHSFHRASSGDDFRIVSEADCEGKECDKVKYSELPTSSLGLDDAKQNEAVTVFTPTVAGTYYYMSTENAYRKGRIIVKWATCSITYPTTTLTTSCEMSAEETITGDLTITYSLSRLRAQSGDVPQITAPANARHFAVNSNKLTLENIELKGGRGSEGGSILVNGGEIDANNVKFTGNTATTGGGAVRVKNSASKVKLSNVLFEDNQGSEGGAISIDATTAAVEIHNTDFKNNRAATGNGGAIKSEAVLNITLTNFESNTANSGEGGSIDTTKDITMKDSSFKNNKARKGGAMRSVGNKVDLSNMVIEANEAIEEGGAFMAENSEFDVRSSTITANKAKKGAAFKTTSSGCTTTCKKLRIRSSSISDNEAASEGGAVDFDGDANAEPQFWIQDTTMTGNKAGGSANNFKKRGAKVKIKAIDSDVGTVDGGSVDTTCATDQCSGRAHSTCEVTATGTKCACDGTSRHLEGTECKVHKVCTGLGLDVEIRAPDKTHDRLCGSKDVAELTHKLDDKGKELANLIEAKLVAEGVAADQAYALAVEVFGEINKCE